MDLKFPRDREDQWKNHGNSGGGGSNMKPSETENPVGGGDQTGKKPSGGGGGGMDIFWNHAYRKLIPQYHFIKPGFVRTFEHYKSLMEWSELCLSLNCKLL